MNLITGDNGKSILKRTGLLIVVILLVVFVFAYLFFFKNPTFSGEGVAFCGDVKLKKLALGIINPKSFKIGDILLVTLEKNEIKSIEYAYSPIGNYEIDSIPPPKNLKVNLIIDFNFEPTVELPQRIKLGVEEKLSSNSELFVKSYYLKRLRDAIDFTNVELPKHSLEENQYYAIIYEGVFADSTYLKFNNGISVGGTTQLDVENYKIAIKYNCDNSIVSYGEKVPIFFDFKLIKRLRVQLNNNISDSVAKATLKSYDFNKTIRIGRGSDRPTNKTLDFEISDVEVFDSKEMEGKDIRIKEK